MVIIVDTTVSIPAGIIRPRLTALGGLDLKKDYDPGAHIAYGKPIEGRKEVHFDWKGTTWRLASAEHREIFNADPEKYPPQ
jgi:hypothetical protein